MHAYTRINIQTYAFEGLRYVISIKEYRVSNHSAHAGFMTCSTILHYDCKLIIIVHKKVSYTGFEFVLIGVKGVI